MTIRSTQLVAVAAVALVATLTGCSSGVEDGGDAPAPGSVPEVVLIQESLGGTPYFQGVAEGAMAEAEKVGIKLTAQFTDSSDEQLSAVDQAISGGAGGIVLQIQDPSLGPTVASKAESAGVAILASANGFADGAGKDAPIVTLDAKQAGTDVGNEVARNYAESGWADDPQRKVRVASLELPALQTCMDRTDSAAEAFLSAEPSFAADDILHLDYDGSLNDALTKMSAAVTVNSDVTDWLVWACNDEGVIGATRALANAGVDVDNIISVGLGGYLACQEWESGEPSALKATVIIDPRINGELVVQVMAAHLLDGADIPAETLIPLTLATPETFISDRSALPC